MVRRAPKQVYMPDYHCANKLGFVLEQVVVAEKLLGRNLCRSEVIYHKDGNIQNNDPDNILVFKSRTAMATYKAGGVLVQNEDGTYSCAKRKSKRLCEYCGREFVPNSGAQIFCSQSCMRLAKRTADMPSKRDLREHLMQMDYADVARLYNVTTQKIMGWCRVYNLPIRKATLYKMRIDAKDKASQRMINQLKSENVKLASQISEIYGDGNKDNGGEEDWLEQ